ncbi:hypothetical protein YC2023_101228 [Brassica napus]
MVKHVPLSLIPAPVYKISIDFINILSLETLTGFVLWASDLILTEWPGVVKVVHPNPNADISKWPLHQILFTGANALKQIFTFSLELAGGQGIGNPALANEATAIAISVLTQDVDCFKQWDVLYKEHLEASVALLKKLVDEWKDHSLKLSSSSSDTLTVKHAMNSFRMKNEKAITEGVANLSLYKEADQSCKLVSRRLSRGPGIAPLTAMVIAAGAAAAGEVVASDCGGNQTVKEKIGRHLESGTVTEMEIVVQFNADVQMGCSGSPLQLKERFVIKTL